MLHVRPVIRTRQRVATPGADPSGNENEASLRASRSQRQTELNDHYCFGAPAMVRQPSP